MGCGGSKKQNVKDTHQVSPNKCAHKYNLNTYIFSKAK